MQKTVMYRWTCRLLAALVLAGVQPLQAQDDELERLVEDSEAEEEDLQQIPRTDISATGQQRAAGRLRLPGDEDVEKLRISQDREIDPAMYIVGPGDVMQMYIWGEFDRPFLLQVNPEGYALVPTIGDFAVSGKTLAQVKEQIIAAAQRKYPGVHTTLTLESMRFFTVYATGAVLREGSLSVHPVTRVSDLIERAGGYLDDLRGAIEETVAGRKVTRTAQIQPQPTGRRSIRLTRRDGSIERVDLQMFLATGDLKYNPYVRMGDVVHVGFRQEDIFIYGSVNKEGVQEYRPGDTFGDLLTLAGGLSGNAPIDEVMLWRFRADGVTSDSISVARDQSGLGVRMDDIASLPLQPKDMLFVRARSDWQLTPNVHISGAVRYRGRYRIVEGETRIRDVVEQAGGFTERASLTQAQLIRVKFRSQRDPEFERLQKLQAVAGIADMTPEDRAYLKTKGREQRGLVAVDFVRLFNEGDESQNLLLAGGDVILVPEKRRTVSVSGSVKRPGLIDFQEGRKASFYLNQAGGYTWNADKGSVRLIRARTGLREKYDRNAVLEPGDELWIPEEEYFDWWDFTQSTMRTVAETLTLIVLVRSF